MCCGVSIKMKIEIEGGRKLASHQVLRSLVMRVIAEPALGRELLLISSKSYCVI